MNLKEHGKSIALWVIISLLLVALFNVFHKGTQKEADPVSLSEFIRKIHNSSFKKVFIRGEDVLGITKIGERFSTRVPYNYPEIYKKLESENVDFSIEKQEAPSLLLQIFLGWLPLILLAGVWFFFFRQMQNNNGRALGFGRTKARISDPQRNIITFADVNGIDEAKQDLMEIVEFLRDPNRFRKIGGKIPHGVLLIGPPGTGKTMLAKAVAGEAKVPFFSISGSDFVEMFVGVGASRVRDLFEQARQSAPCIIFIDEIDAVGRNRGVGLGGGNDEREQTLNQLLVEMDGFGEKEEIIVLAATNRVDVIDPALLRPGRFDRRVDISLPDVTGREEILRGHMKTVSIAEDVNPRDIARGTPGFSGADLANLVNESALLAARKRKRLVSMADFEESKDKLLMGSERRSLVMAEKERELTAYHEAGHAVVAYHSSERTDPIHKATIIPRGRALGMVVQLPEGDRVSISRSQLIADITVAMGGRAAEELKLGRDDVTTGASGDFREATRLARRMVIEWGMSDTLGPLFYASTQGPDSMYNPMFRQNELSEEVIKKIDQEVRKIIDDAYGNACEILKKNSKHLELVAKYLLEYETLTGEEIGALIVKGVLQKERNKVENSQPKREKSPPKKRNTPKKAQISGGIQIQEG